MALLRRQHRTMDVALILALFLVVQALFSGFSIGARAETLPAAGVLCLGSGQAAPASDSDPRSGLHLVDCCTLGCPMVGGAAAPEPAGVPLRLTSPRSANLVPVLHAHDPGRAELSPLRSRAPPLA